MMRVGTRAPRGHRIIAIVAILWSLAGVAAFLFHSTMSAETIAAMPPEQQTLWLERPAWHIAAYGSAVFAQLAGAIGLLLGRRWAIVAFAISIVAVLAQNVYPFLLSGVLSLANPAHSAFPAVILALAIAQFLYARWAARDGLLR